MADQQGRPRPHLGDAPRPESPITCRADGSRAGTAWQDQVERRIPRLDAELEKQWQVTSDK